MKIYRLLPFIAFVIFGLSVSAQPALKIAPNALDSLPSTITWHGKDTASVPVTVLIFNSGDTAFLGALNIMGSVNGAPLSTSPNSFPSDSGGIYYPNDTATVFISPGETIPVSFVFVVDSPPFADGPSVVVIWPVGLGARTIDSASWSLTIQTGTAAINNATTETLKVFVAEQQLWVQCSEQNLLEYVRIYDVNGALMAGEKIGGNITMPMNQYATGMYLAEVTLTDNSRRLFKIFNPPPGGR
jgi:hypothetical protein